MAQSRTQAVVIPVYKEYLDVLTRRPNDLTTMIWGWQGNSKPMAAPGRLLRKQGTVPFLFRPVESTGHVTHVAISGLIVHSGSPAHRKIAQWLHDRRVEGFAGRKNWNDDVRSFYVVTAARELPAPIPFQDLTLVSENRPLDPGMVRGYATVFMPGPMATWYDAAVRTWGACALPSVARS